MLRPLLVIALSAALLAPAAAGLGQNPAQATRVQKKVRQLELLDQILPVLLTKEQVNNLLPTIQTARQEERNLQFEEGQILAGLEPKLDAAMANALTKKQVVPGELADEIKKAYSDILRKRNALVAKHSAAIGKKVAEVLDEGQLNAAANALDPRFFNPNANPDTMSRADKLGYWATGVLLDPDSYDLLTKMTF